jgi:hypothetical protein
MLHFAPRYGIVSLCLTRSRPLRLHKPANDNGAGLYGARGGANDDVGANGSALLSAALRLFAAHGLSAALRASEAADIAAASGDRDATAWWIAICGTFDSAMARACAARHGC